MARAIKRFTIIVCLACGLVAAVGIVILMRAQVPSWSTTAITATK